jgi:hypothetical protein
MNLEPSGVKRSRSILFELSGITFGSVGIVSAGFGTRRVEYWMKHQVFTHLSHPGIIDAVVDYVIVLLTGNHGSTELNFVRSTKFR